MISRVIIDHTGQGRFESGQMCTAFCRIDVIGIGKYRFAVASCVLQRNFYFLVFIDDFEIYDVFMDWFLVTVLVLDEFLDAAFIVEYFFLLLSGTFVFQGDLDALVEEGHFAETSLQRLKIVNDIVKDFRIRPESGL